MTARVLCCMCGVLIEPNTANTCSFCLASQSDITRGISTEATLHQCRGCGRWHKDAGKWIACELESRELMGLCLGHVSGLKNSAKQQLQHQERVRLIDAGWIWTEPHSMRLKVRLTVQREVQKGTILQQSFTVTFIVRNQQCTECQAEFRQGSWVSLVQVRQRVRHKRTFLFLEQLILKHDAHRGCHSIETFKDGMDFYFPDKGKAARFIAFLEHVCPIKVKTSKKLISTDVKSNIANFKYTNYVEICPLCKDDLLYLPVRMARNLGNIARLVLVKNISNVIHLIDPLSGQTASMTAEVFWRDPIRPIITAARSRMTRYVVLGKDAVFLRPNASKRNPTRKQKSRLASLIVAREEDLGMNDQQFEERSHVGYLMKSGDVCVGYDLTDTNLADDEAETVRTDGHFPSVIVIRKLYGAAAGTNDETQAAAAAAKNRMWRLQRLNVKVGGGAGAGDNEEEGGGETGGASRGRGKRNGSAAIEEREEMDEEEFLQEVEADKEMRLQMNLYKNIDVVAPSKTTTTRRRTNSSMASGDEMVDDDDDDDEDDQRITLDELLDTLALDDGADPDGGGAAAGMVAAPKTLGVTQNDDDDDAAESSLFSSIYEEGARAAKDGLKYVTREEVRSMPDKGTPVVVVVNDSMMNTAAAALLEHKDDDDNDL